MLIHPFFKCSKARKQQNKKLIFHHFLSI